MAKTTAPKLKTRYVCSQCGSLQPKWQGKCPDCGEWNTLTEEVFAEREATEDRRRTPMAGHALPQKLSEISADAIVRLPLPIGEFSRVLGGGIVPGSLVLIGGEPGVGKCITKDTRVFNPHTGQFKSILDYQNCAKTQCHVLSVDENTLTASPQTAIAFHRQGKKAVYEIVTKLGRSLRLTANHPLLTPSGWQPLSELAVGERIATPRSLPYFGHADLPTEKIKLIAYILSDGSAVGSAVSITNMLPEVEQDAHDIARYFGMTVTTYLKPDNKAKQFRFTNKAVDRQTARAKFSAQLRHIQSSTGLSKTDFARKAGVNPFAYYSQSRGECVPDHASLANMARVAQVGISELQPQLRDIAAMKNPVAAYLEEVNLRGKTAANKCVPDCIFCLPKEQLALFLKTLFTCDGSVFVDKDNHGVSYSTISKTLAKDVQHLLLRFGLVAKLRTKHTKLGLRAYTAYEVTLQGIADTQKFLEEIGIEGRLEAKQKIASRSTPKRPSTHRDTIPTGLAFWQTIFEAKGNDNFREMCSKSGVHIKNRRHEKPISRYLLQAIAKACPHPMLNSLAYGDVYWDEIVSIEPCGEEDVYDISVSQKANFVANDLFIHNSTLLTQCGVEVAKTVGTTLYVSGEESAHQIKMRAERLGVGNADLYLLTETNLDSILASLESLKPQLAIIDSIQTMYAEGLSSAAGTVSQIRECAQRLQAAAKASGTAIFIVGHVTKEGTIAGPKVLEHIVDTVLQLEGDRFHTFRLLRSTKNRFGATSEVGVFEMVGSGMKEVTNPSEAFLAERMSHAPGSTVAVTMEGTRPILVEVQALASPTQNPMPRRTANGFDYNRLFLLIAVLGKRVGVRVHDHDVFLNVVGGMSIEEPAADLAAAVAIASAYKGTPVPAEVCVIGEVGLSGEVRSVGQLNARINEAAKLGFTRCIVPKTVRKIENAPQGITLLPVRSIGEALDVALER